MLRRLAVLLVSVSVLLAGRPLGASDWAEVIRTVELSLVWVEVGDHGACTGFVIDQTRHYIMTAAHCAPTEPARLWVDRVPATIVSRDTKKDLLVVEAPHLNPARPALRLAAKNPERGQEVMSAGFGYALERPFFRLAHVQDDALTIPDSGIGGPYISTDAPFVNGQSGGPVVNLAGEVVCIVQRGDGGTTGLGVGAELIRERMGRFFGK